MKKSLECRYCGVNGDWIDSVCISKECKARMYRSYSEDAFREFCEREGCKPEDWNEYFAELDRQHIDSEIQSNTRSASHALQRLLSILKEQEIVQSNVSLFRVSRIRYNINRLQDALKAVENVSKYRVEVSDNIKKE